MEIEIVPVESKLVVKPPQLSHVVHATAADSVEQIFAEFLELEVGDGDASKDTIKSYLSQSKMYFKWCRENLVPILEADRDDIKLYRQYLIYEGYKIGTIANKLSIVHTFYRAAIAKRLIAINPATGIKAPTERIDPASNISYLELEEVELLLGEIDAQLVKAKTNKQRLSALRDRVLALRQQTDRKQR